MKLDLDLNVIEELALSKDDLIHQYCAKLILRVRQLEHDLTDPNYLYAGTRICRQAIVCRNEQIEARTKEIMELRQLAKDGNEKLSKMRAELDEVKKPEPQPKFGGIFKDELP